MPRKPLKSETFQRLSQPAVPDGNNSAAKMFYLEEKVNPVLQEMVMSLLTVCPADPQEFMLRWLLEQDTFDRGGINSLEDAAREQAEIDALKKEAGPLEKGGFLGEP
ncbi:unnamed protein product [Effrenium voratum]|nr:unnamed protein product [Effrenium voratum]